MEKREFFEQELAQQAGLFKRAKMFRFDGSTARCITIKIVIFQLYAFFNLIWWVWLSWLKRWFVAPEIVGSNPTIHPIKPEIVMISGFFYINLYAVIT